MKKSKFNPTGKKVNYDDDLVMVYTNKGEVDYDGMFDYCPYKNEDYKWNEKGYYDLPQGYKMVVL